MTMHLHRDVVAGALFMLIGALALIVARGYPAGSAMRMGPGYFPNVLAGLLVLFGIYLVASGLAGTETLSGGWSLRALVILPLSLVLFGALIDRAGFVPAMLVLTFGSATASTEVRLVEALVFSAFLTLLCAAVFVWGLGLPYALFAGP